MEGKSQPKYKRVKIFSFYVWLENKTVQTIVTIVTSSPSVDSLRRRILLRRRTDPAAAHDGAVNRSPARYSSRR
jgi:hypothetical protein